MKQESNELTNRLPELEYVTSTNLRGPENRYRDALERIASYPDANPISDAHYIARQVAREALAPSEYSENNEKKGE